MISALIAVRNEESTVQNVVKAAISNSSVGKVVVVNDASTDGTKQRLEGIGSEKLVIVDLKEQAGKGRAVKVGCSKIDSDIIVLIDADLVGFRSEYIDLLVNPIINEGAFMVIGLRDKGIPIANMLMPYFPLSGGERAIKKKVLLEILSNPLIEGYGLESVMNHYCRINKLKVSKVRLNGVNHFPLMIKKYGLVGLIKKSMKFVSTNISLFKFYSRLGKKVIKCQ